MSSPEYESLFQRALISRGEAYLMTESEIAGAPESVPTLREHLDDPDPVARLAASVMIEWNESSDADFAEVPRYLDKLDRRFAPTAAGTPPITAVVENLTAKFGARIAEFLALRLVQQPTNDWKTLAALGYLDRHKDPATTDALIRFASETREPKLQQLTAQVLSRLGDPGLPQKIARERDRLSARGATLPAAIASLTSPPSHVA